MKTAIPAIRSMERQYEEYLRDESRRCGTALEICFPKTREALAAALAYDGPVTLQGARTGLDGRAVPQGGRIVNLSRMDRILSGEPQADGSISVHAEAGVSMAALSEAFPAHFFAPAPTEPAATVGGVVASDARGIFADRYGAAAAHVYAVDVLKTAGADVIVSARLRLLPRPATVWGVAFLFQDDVKARVFCERASHIAALAVNEYLDRGTLACLRLLRQNAQRLQALPETGDAEAMVYTELHTDTEDEAGALAGELLELSANGGCGEGDTWALCGETEVQLLWDFRHAAQEAVHASIDRLRMELPALYALGADMALPPAGYDVLRDALGALGIPYACFGHLIGGRVRLNLLPESMEAFYRAEAFIERWRERGGV